MANIEAHKCLMNFTANGYLKIKPDFPEHFLFKINIIFVVSHIDIHDITEILLKVALNTINQTNQALWHSPYTHLYRSILKTFLKRVMYMISIHVNCGVYSEYAIDTCFSTK